MFELIGPHLDRLDLTDRGSVLEMWANLASQAGDVVQARRLDNQAFQAFEKAGADLDAARCMMLMSGDFWRAKEERRAIENAALAVQRLRALSAPPDLLADALSYQALIHFLGDNVEQGNRAIRDAIDLAPPGSEQMAFARATAVWGATTWADADRLGGEALRLANRVNSSRSLEATYGILTQWASREVPPAVPTTIVEDALSFAEAHQLDDLRAFALLAAAHKHLQAGRYVEAEDVAGEAATIWPSNEDNLAALPLSMTARPQMRRGSIQTSRTLDMLNDSAEIGPPIVDFVSDLIVEAHWLNTDRPFDRDLALRDHRFHMDHLPVWPIGHSALVYWLWKLGIDVDYPEQLHSQYRSQINGDWERAADEWGDWERPYERAMAMSEGPPEAAIEALTTLDEIGAAPLAARIRRELREKGVTGVPAGPRPSTRANTALLTTRQLEVLRLMAEGLTNIEIADTLFISSRTAEHHVSAVLSKLNASTRDAAVTIAKRLGAIDPS
jgi:DNA-binding CsgD family transcriptional regulator